MVSAILPTDELLFATEKALDGGVDMMQFSAGKEVADMHVLGSVLAGLAKKHEVPFLVNNNLELAKEVEADGVHFDTYDVAPTEARRVLGHDCIVGYTVNTDLDKIKWAQETGADYVSFCSVFNQCTATTCAIVPLETVRQAKSVTNLSIFAAGGINLKNAHLVLETGVDGIAVTSAILKSENPEQTAKAFQKIISQYNKK